MFEKLTAFTKKVTDLADKPTLNAAQLKAQFDAAPDEVRQYLNKLIDALKSTTAGDSGAKNIGVSSISNVAGNDVQTILDTIAPYALGGNTVPLANNEDLNTLSKSGVYSVYAPVNGPLPSTSPVWCVVINLQHNAAYQQQMLILFSGNTAYESIQFNRSKVNNVWRGWRETQYNEYPVWSNLPLLNGATNSGFTPQYTSLGKVCYVRGRVNDFSLNTTFATLPAEYQPGATQYFKLAADSLTAGADVTVKITALGEMSVVSKTHAVPFWLTGISFPIDFKG